MDKCDNAVTAVRKALAASSALSKLIIKVFAQGSYCNRTNVREDSDVDVCVRCSDSFFYYLPPELSPQVAGFVVPGPVNYATYKNDLGAALTAYFKDGHVTRGNKAFDIKENTYRIAADVVPCFEFRRYAMDGSHIKGTAFDPDNGGRIQNWPDQHYANGVSKNTDTGGRFKDVVRIFKRLRYKMCEEKIAAADPIPSFLVECLVWNAPNSAFGHETYTTDVREVLANLFNDTIKFETCSEWGEINELKYLFRTGQPWTLTQAHAFISAAWDYWGFD
ncbi:MAG: nucleotidyltransferase [Candidatus Acidiferrales bacterium]